MSVVLLSQAGKLLFSGGWPIPMGATAAVLAAIGPAQVGGLAAGTPGTVSIPVTYTTAGGTAPVTYAGRMALHGSTSFTPNNGAFSATGGQFVGLSAGTAYDLQVVATNSAGSSTTTLLNISTGAAPVVAAPPPTQNANRFDVVFGQSVYAPGATATGTLFPNGLWTGGSVTLTPQAGTAVTVALPGSGSAAVPFSFVAPSIGDDVFTVTNTAGLYNPWSPQINVFAASLGTARTLGATLAGLAPDMRTHQRDTASGAPTGFPSTFSRGWGQVAINVTNLSGATDGVWVRLFDAMSAGATATVGTGTALHPSPVQIHGALGATGTITPLLPAGPNIYYADLATDAAFTNPVRLASRFRVGVVVGQFTRSQECGLTRDYNDGGTTFPAIYTKTSSWVSTDHRYPGSSYNGCYWFLQDNVGRNQYQYDGGVSSSGAEEFGRLLEDQLGVCVSITGTAEAGGDFDAMVGHDGSLCAGFTGTVGESCNGKFRYFWANTTGWQGIDGAYPIETTAEDRVRYLAAVDWIARTYAACAVIGWNTGATGWFGLDGSRVLGYTRNQMIFLNEIEPSNRMVISKESYTWNEYNGGHATMGARQDYVRAGFRKLMAAELAVMGGLQTASRGPTLGASGTYNATTRTITLPYALGPDATQLVALKRNYSDPNATNSTPTAAELANLFSVYAGTGRRQAGFSIYLSGATFDAKNVYLVLDGSSGIRYYDDSDANSANWHSAISAAVPASFTVHYAADFGLSNGALVPGDSRASVTLTDNRTGNGIPYGWHMLPALDISVR